MKRIFLISFLLVGMFMIMFSPITSSADGSADSGEKYDIDISLTPVDVLFNIENMKPGDWAPREIMIKNNGKLDFDYQMLIKNEGDSRLYNELLLEIKDEANTLYSGKLGDFDKLATRFLAVNDSEELEFTIRFPEELGNEFQGLGVEFQLQFVAERSSKPTDPENPDEEDNKPDNPEEGNEQPGGSKDDSGKGGKNKDVETVNSVVNNSNSSGGGQLPDTASNMFNFIVIGVYLLLAGGLIWMISKRRKSKVRRV